MELWLILVIMLAVFVVLAKLLMAKRLFETKVLQWGKCQKTFVKSEAAWVYLITVILMIIVGMGEYRKFAVSFATTALTTLMQIGLVLIVLGLIVWLLAMHARKQYLWFFQVLASKEIVPPYSTNGIYSMIRNPRDLGLLLVLAGFAATLQLKFTLAFVIVLFLATAYRVSSRDRVFIEKYGKPYLDYMTKTKKLIPYIY